MPKGNTGITTTPYTVGAPGEAEFNAAGAHKERQENLEALNITYAKGLSPEHKFEIEEKALAFVRKPTFGDIALKELEPYKGPDGGFFLWLPVEDGEEAALKLWRETGVRVLPGAYLAREVDGHNPGKGYIRVALVAPKEEMRRGLEMLRDCLYG